MYPQDPAVPQTEDAPDIDSMPPINRVSFIPTLVCAGIGVILMQTGFLSLFFLVPLGVCSVVFGPTAAWLGFLVATLGNGVLSLGLSLHSGAGLGNAGMEILYFSVLSLGFTWIMAGSPIPALPPIRTIFRFITASIAGALVFLGMIFSMSGEEGFSTMLYSQIEAISRTYVSSLGTDAAGQAILEHFLTPDRIIETFFMIVYRGGALISAFFLFFFSRQAAFILARLFRRQDGTPKNDLIGFYAPRKAIWVLSLCLPVIVLCRKAASLQLIEITAWNLLVICAIMFLAQGGGIVLFNLASRFKSRIMRLFGALLFIFMAFSPGINILAIGILILLGIAENWLPLRKVRKDLII